MRHIATIIILLVASTIGPGELLADSWPKLSSGPKGGVCAEALQIAEGAFQSDSVHLYAPPAFPPDLPSTIVLQPSALDISGGDALKADDEFFEKVPIGGTSRSIYWQRNARFGKRLVVQETPVGWRGDMYTLFSVDEGVNRDSVLAEIATARRTPIFKPTIEDNWRPPLVFKHRASSEVWVIDVGQPFYVMGDWRVYALSAEGLQLRCSLQFRPSVTSSINLLPSPVRNLAALMDQTVGPGANEGTLQPTARLRLEVQHMWANAALRPWALPRPYNTREEVDDGLLQWSRKGGSYLSTYRHLRDQYPLAEEALARYYQKTFTRTEKEATVMAAYVLDVALRSHYTFPSSDPDKFSRITTQPNPWRRK